MVVGLNAVTLHGAPAWVAVKTVSPMVTVPVLTDDWVLGVTVTFTVALFLLQSPMVAVIQGTSDLTDGAGQTVIPDPVTVTFVLSPNPLAGKVLDMGERV